MKKYEKPMLCYEDFQLAQSIAGNCTVIYNLAQNSCTVGDVVPDKIIGIPADLLPFSEGATNCRIGPVHDDYCYWNGGASYRGFNS